MLWFCFKTVAQRYSLNQSDAKLKPMTTWSFAFSFALGSVVGFTLNFHWHLKIFSFLLLLRLVLVGRNSIGKYSYVNLLDALQVDNISLLYFEVLVSLN